MPQSEMEGTQPLAGIWQFRDKARRSVNSLLACVQVVPHTCQPHSCSSEFNAKFSNCVFLQEHRQQLFLWSSLLFWTFAQEMTDHRFPSPFFLIWSCRIYISDFWESAVPCCEDGRETILSVPQWHWTVGQQGQEGRRNQNRGLTLLCKLSLFLKARTKGSQRSTIKWALQAGSRVLVT